MRWGDAKRVGGVAVLLLAGLAWGQAEPSREPAAPQDEDEVRPDSPRAALLGFYERLRADDYAGAASYLDLPRSRAAAGPELARKLGEVLDGRGWVDLSNVSPRSSGEERDGLPPGEDRVGTVRGEKDRPEPLMMVRQDRPSGSRWVFAPATVERVNAWASLLQPPLLERHLPQVLLEHGPRDLRWWQWLALPLVFLLALAMGRLLARPTQWLFARLASHTRARWDDLLVQQLTGPVALVWALALVSLSARFLLLSPIGLTFVHQVLRAGLLIALFWALMRGLVMLGEVAKTAPWANVGVQSAMPLLLRIARVFVVAIGAVMVISEFGYPVASLIAGLGIGGLAVALAAQKTVENMFGSISIGVDQPFRVGDFVKVEDFTGTVENLGLRSTRIRTLDRTLISIPNGKLADMRIETFAPRDRIRLFMKLGVEYGARSEQLRQLRDGLEQRLLAHPKLHPEGRSVRLIALGESAIELEVAAYFATADWGEFMAIREELLLDFLAIVERAGARVAHPTRTIHLRGDAAGERRTQ